MVPCKEWPNARNKRGYGVTTGGLLVHRMAYRLAYPNVYLHRWIDIHHLCGNKLCYEITHLEAKPATNHRLDHMEKRRSTKTHCVNGHEFTEETTSYQQSDGYACRYCKVCRKLQAKERRQRAKRKASKDTKV